MKILHSRNTVVLACKLDGILVYNPVKHKGIDYTAVRRRLDFHIRSYTASVTDDASGSRLEFVRERIRNMSHTSVLIAVSVVYGLYTASGRSVILGCRNLQLTVVGNRAYGLNQTLPITALTKYGCPVHILKRSGNDF